MSTFEINQLLRDNIKSLTPYASARTEFKGTADVWLDANESPYDELGYNRYPDPLQKELKEKLAQIKGVETQNLFLGNGSDEIIDLLIRLFCEPYEDAIITFTPSYTMYITSANINAVEVLELPLTATFDLPLKELEKVMNSNAKLLFICTPNNPVGRIIPLDIIASICKKFSGLVVVDEAYIDFSTTPSALSILSEYKNLFVLQTLSKAFGMAGLRIGLGYASVEIIELLNRIKPPYNISQATQELALELLKDTSQREQSIAEVIEMRNSLYIELKKSSLFTKVYRSEGNFILVQTKYCTPLYNYLCKKGVVIRKRDIPPLLPNGLRFTVGLPKENERLLALITQFENENLY